MLTISEEHYLRLPKTQFRVYRTTDVLPNVEENEITSENYKDVNEIPSANDKDEIMVAVIPTIGGMLFIATIGLVIFIFMARKKRSLHGTYSPQNEEFKAPISYEMTHLVLVDEKFKERLI